ncbi:hypothetical protein [Kitasatospora camelliae]|uniref:Uncharacterized protein n=1 Tax=Kitasatospora camelliae TaxID=3156397 RepID=A0AAU8JPR8_9ACTN
MIWLLFKPLRTLLAAVALALFRRRHRATGAGHPPGTADHPWRALLGTAALKGPGYAVTWALVHRARTAAARRRTSHRSRRAGVA